MGGACVQQPHSLASGELQIRYVNTRQLRMKTFTSLHVLRSDLHALVSQPCWDAGCLRMLAGAHGKNRCMAYGFLLLTWNDLEAGRDGVWMASRWQS